MPLPEHVPKFSTIRSPPIAKETRRWTYLVFESGNKVSWVVEDWPDARTMTPLVFSSCFTSPLILVSLINCISHWIYPKTYVVDDSIQLHKLLLDSQLSSSKTYDCRALIIKQASDEDVKTIRSILEKPMCRMRGLRNLAHISFGKVDVYPLLLYSKKLMNPPPFVDLNIALCFTHIHFFSHMLLISILAPSFYILFCTRSS